MIAGKFSARENSSVTETKMVPVKMTFSNEFCDPEFNPDDILRYNLDQNYKSMDNKGWSDWWQLKDVSSANNRTCFKRICKN